MEENELVLLSQKDYVEGQGLRCPICNQTNVAQNREVDVGIETVFVPVGCRACGTDWVDIYTLTGYDNLDVSGSVLGTLRKVQNGLDDLRDVLRPVYLRIESHDDPAYRFYQGLTDLADELYKEIYPDKEGKEK